FTYTDLFSFTLIAFFLLVVTVLHFFSQRSHLAHYHRIPIREFVILTLVVLLISFIPTIVSRNPLYSTGLSYSPAMEWSSLSFGLYIGLATLIVSATFAAASRPIPAQRIAVVATSLMLAYAGIELISLSISAAQPWVYVPTP